jgi:uncharacterized protein DUF4262
MPRKHNDVAENKLLENVEKFGWHVMLITEEKDVPGWAFSVGLYHTFKHPEIVIFGLPKDRMHSFINVIGEDVRAGRFYRSGVPDTELIPGYTSMFQTVEKIWYGAFLGYATWFYEGSDFPVLQCIWPDKQNKLPWEADFNSELLRLQPLLFHDEPKAARAEKFLQSIENAEHHDHDWRPELEKGSHHKFKPGEWPFSDRVNFRGVYDKTRPGRKSSDPARYTRRDRRLAIPLRDNEQIRGRARRVLGLHVREGPHDRAARGSSPRPARVARESDGAVAAAAGRGIEACAAPFFTWRVSKSFPV